MTVNCVLLKGFKGLLRWQTQTDTAFSREISDRVRVVACLTTLPNIIHSDSPSETLAVSEWQMLKKSMGASDGDTIVLVWGNKVDAATGASEIVIRSREATIGVPSETRQALRDGTNGFERILPGPDRMYPDTDLPPKRITAEHLAHLSHSVPRPFWQNEKWYKALGLPADLIGPLSISPLAGLFESAVKEWNLPPTLTAIALIQYPKRASRRLGRRIDLQPALFREVLLAYKNSRLAREGILPALILGATGAPLSVATLPPPCSEDEVNEAIDLSAEELSAMRLHHPDKKPKVFMGLVMQKLRGRVDGSRIAEKLAATQEGERQ
jgi:glutamyl-tRNA(Gln) amidotransferase subunit E